MAKNISGEKRSIHKNLRITPSLWTSLENIKKNNEFKYFNFSDFVNLSLSEFIEKYSNKHTGGKK